MMKIHRNWPVISSDAIWHILSQDIKGKTWDLSAPRSIISPRATAATPRCSAKAWLTSWWGPTLQPWTLQLCGLNQSDWPFPRCENINPKRRICQIQSCQLSVWGPLSDELLVSRVKFRFDEGGWFWWKQYKSARLKPGFPTTCYQQLEILILLPSQ